MDQVVISCGTEVIARHIRSYERDDFVYHPTHYLPLLERKPGALDQAAPLHGWDLPEEFGTLRVCWKPAWDAGASVSMSRCSGCWRLSLFEEVSRASTKHTSGVSMVSIKVRASCSGEVSQRQAGSRLGG